MMTLIRRPNQVMTLLLLAIVTTLVSAVTTTAIGQEPDRQTSSRTLISRGSVAFTQPFRTMELAAAEPGRIAEMSIRRGSRVKKGDLLVELDVASLLAARRTAEQRSTSTARKEALEVELDRKLRMQQMLKGLSIQGAGTTEELLDAEAEAKIARLNVREQEESLERAKLELAEIDAKIELRRIRAKFDGVVIEMHREVGEYVAATNSKVATVVDLSQLRLSFFLPTDTALKLHEGDAVEVQFVRSRQTTSAVIEYVGPLTHADSGRVRIDVVIDNHERKFRSGLQCVLPQITSKLEAAFRPSFDGFRHYQ